MSASYRKRRKAHKVSKFYRREINRLVARGGFGIKCVFESSLANVDRATVEQARRYLYNKDLGNFFEATVYFFTEDSWENEKTFASLCQRNNIKPNEAARAIWDKLPDKQKRLAIELFKEHGYIFTHGP